jgi:ubiquinone/menaquinone biosynthesis C-methylase UbiE
MIKGYQDNHIAKEYLKFINSADGQFQQQSIWEAFSSLLPSPGQKVLDAACGNGWLSDKLFKFGLVVEACDISPFLVNEAKKNHPQINFKIADLNTTLPYSENEFVAVIFNMAAHDVSNLQNAMNEIARVVKKDGQVIVSIANPYYSLPIGTWKRGFLRFLLGLKPKLKLTNYFNKKNQTSRSFVWKKILFLTFTPCLSILKRPKVPGLL